MVDDEQAEECCCCDFLGELMFGFDGLGIHLVCEVICVVIGGEFKAIGLEVVCVIIHGGYFVIVFCFQLSSRFAFAAQSLQMVLIQPVWVCPTLMGLPQSMQMWYEFSSALSAMSWNCFGPWR